MDLIQELAKHEMSRQLEKDPSQFKAPVSPLPDKKPWLTPEKLATVGGLTDAASTYYFLKAGKGKESNAMLGFTNNHPEATMLGALGGLGLSKAATAVIRRLSPKAADAIAANLGALQLSYGMGNTMPDRIHSSSRHYQAMMQRVMSK